MKFFNPFGITILFSISFLILTCAISCNSVKNNRNFKIRGSFNGLDTGTIKMMSIEGDSLIYSSEIKNGKFNLQGYIESPQLLLFNISPYSWNFRAFVEEGELEIHIDTIVAKHFGNRRNPGEGWALIWEVDQKGSELATIYKQYQIDIKSKDFINEANLWTEKLKMEKISKHDSQFINRRIDSLKIVFEKRRRYWIDSLVNTQPGSIAGPFILNEYYVSQSNNNLDDILSMISKFKPPATTSIYFHALETLAKDLQSLQMNSIAPDFTLQTPDKTDFTLSEIKGKYVLLDFWASWCGPCRKAIPHWKKVYRRYHDKGFTIVGISNDRNWDDWIKALNKEKMPWIQVVDKFPKENHTAIVSDQYKIHGFPYYVLIGKEGQIIFSTQSHERMQEFIDDLFIE